MKIKKSQLIELIKEEIMSEMRGLTIMDDPTDDAAVPASMQHGGLNDESIAIVSNYLVTQGLAGDSREAAIRGMEMLEQAGFSNADPAAIKQIISGEKMDEDEPMMEGVENITPENVQLVMAALQVITMAREEKSLLDRGIEKVTSRKLLVWVTASALMAAGVLESGDWVIISGLYLGGQSVIDSIARLKGLE
jgi:hypothetical protein